MIQSRNIDFTTITGDTNNMPIAHRDNVGLGYSSGVNLIRCGNIVQVVSNFTNASLGVINDHYKIVETIPLGYRPTSVTSILSMVASGTNLDISITIMPDGSMYFSNRANGSAKLSYSGMWITNDPFPTSDIPRQ